MTSIDQLIGRSGTVRYLLGIPDDGETLDISKLDWENGFDVVRGIRFDRIRLCNTHVSADFVECTFEDAELSGIRSESHFFGAGNTWQRCVFKDVALVDAIAPQTRFVDCDFYRMSVRGMRLCQTLFENCRFEECAIHGLAARHVGDRSLQIPEVVRAGGTALYRACKFERGEFVGCSFAGIAFERCDVNNTKFVNCDFRGVVGQDEWWSQFESGDPFNAFLTNILRGIEKRLGRESHAFRAMAAYAEDYHSKRVKSQDYSACLYAGDVPDEELDAIQDILDSAEASFLL